MTGIVTATYEYGDTLERVIREFGVLPAKIEKARRRAIRKLMSFVRRQILREVAKVAQTTQKVLLTALRYRATLTKSFGIDIWIGTNPLKAHYLGRVRWTRRMKGARVGRRLFLGSWSWGVGSQTGAAVIRRSGDTRLPIEQVEVEIHEAIKARVDSLIPQINARFETLIRQEIRFSLNVEGNR